MTEKKLNIRNPNEVYYKPLGEEEYSDESFLKGYAKLGGLEQALTTLKEDTQNTDATKLAGGVLFNNENWFYKTNTSPRPALEEASSDGRKGLEKYFTKNEKEILEKFGSEEYKYLVTAVPLAKINEEGEHKTIVDAINEFKKVQESATDTSKMGGYVAGKMKSLEKNAPYVAKEFARYSSNEAFIKQMFTNYAVYAENNFKEVLERGDCEGVFKESLKGAKKKGQYYNEMAKVLYEKISKENKK